MKLGKKEKKLNMHDSMYERERKKKKTEFKCQWQKTSKILFICSVTTSGKQFVVYQRTLTVLQSFKGTVAI